MSELKTSLNECLEKLKGFKISYIEQETGLSRYYILIILANNRDKIKLSHLDVIIEFLNKHSINEKNITITRER